MSGKSGMLHEDAIESVPHLPTIPDTQLDEGRIKELLRQVAVIKLNGGLGTSMGLDRAKSLLVVKEGQTFLDLIAKQLLALKETHGVPVEFRLMNSFSTSADTLEHLASYPQLGDVRGLELMQNRVPKIDRTTGFPVVWSQDPELEWCPPGHGDIYSVLAGSGTMDAWRAQGIRYVFVSNADNLGATLDLALLDFFVRSAAPFLMEVTARTLADRKGGHLCRNRADGRLMLREVAQCSEEDVPAFQDIGKHRFFNTNNLWLDLDALARVMRENEGALPLPVIRNLKTVDSRDVSSPVVWQLETAMGAAIESFSGAAAVEVSRSRFAPVKTTSDLLLLRSDAYRVTETGSVVLDRVGGREVPVVDLAPAYKKMEDFERLTRDGVPSLRNCRSLRVTGPVYLHSRAELEGDVVVEVGAAGGGLPEGCLTGTVVVG
jgi:UDP-N-acetylglucosamine pyrophosphorylase